MKLKSNLLTAIFLLITSVTLSQDYKSEIKNEFNAYIDAIVSQDFEKSMNYLTDDFFKIIPKAQMIQLMERTFNNPEMEFELKNPKIVSVGDKESFGEKYYTLLIYSTEMDMKIQGPEEENENDRKLRNSLMKVNFQKSFGVENVKYDEEKDTYEIKSTKEVYAISDNGKTNWKFLVVEKKQKFILEQLLPEKLIDRIYNTKANEG